jgi:hypothetical protein
VGELTDQEGGVVRGQGTPFVIGTRVVVRVEGASELAVGELGELLPEMWSIQLAEPVDEGTFPPGARVVITTSASGGLCFTRTQLLRRTEGMLVVARPRSHNHRDRRRDVRVPSEGSVAWATRSASGMARVVDVSRSGLKMEAGRALRVGDIVALDVNEAGRVSGLLVGLTEDEEGRWAHIAFTRVTDDDRDRVFAALTLPGLATVIDLDAVAVADVPA